MDRDHSCPVSRRALSRYGRLGNPRFTLVSEGNPLRRLLLGSKKNSLVTAVSPFRWIARHIGRGGCSLILAQAVPELSELPSETGPNMIRVILPQHLRTLAHVGTELTVEIEGTVTQRSVLDAIEAGYPMLRGTIRDHVTQQRRPFLRFFACEEDLSHESPDAPLPESVATGKEPFLIIGAIAGG
jgi:molybdopterin synthase sulfur carrier subunit